MLHLRQREEDLRTTYVNTWRWLNTRVNPNPPWETYRSPPILGEYAVSRDVATPQFRKRIESGEVINNPFHVWRYKMFTDFAGVFLTRPDPAGGEDQADLRGPGWGAANPSGMLTLASEAEIRAGLDGLVSRAQERVATETLARKGKSNMDSLVSLGELKETISLLRNPFGTGMKLAASIERKLSRNLQRPWEPGLLAKRWDLRESGSVRKELSSIALEYMYGLRPLVRETEQILDVLANGFAKHSPRERTGAAESFTVPVAWVDPNGNHAGIRMTRHVSATVSVTVKAGCLYHYSHELEAANRNWGVRLTDVPSALWALMPSSFVVDWFWGVNSFIKALTPIAGLVTDAEWTVVHKTIVLTSYSSDWTLWSDPTWKSRTPATERTYLLLKEVRRSPASLTPSITRTRLSDGAKSLAFGQAAGLLALFTQKLDPLMRDLGPFLPKVQKGRRV